MPSANAKKPATPPRVSVKEVANITPEADRVFKETMAGLREVVRPSNTVTLSAGLIKELDAIAEEKGVDRDYLVEKLLHQRLGTQEPLSAAPSTPASAVIAPKRGPNEPQLGIPNGPVGPLPGETDDNGVTWGVRVEGGSDD